MTRPTRAPHACWPVAAGILGLLTATPGLSGFVTPALAQGTPAQREACAPDAIRLCQEAIPDVPRTKACMRKHVTDLSPRCRTAFFAATRDRRGAESTPRPAAKRRQARLLPAAEPSRRRQTGRLAPPSNDHMPGPRFIMPGDRETRADARRARSIVRRLCRTDILDRDTCAFTKSVIDLAR